ncbi:RNA-directed DNA polymerase, eukaryota [Tanacetum coccineum]
MAARARSNVDHTRLISKSIFVTNFPDNTTSKDLWEVCKGYGTVVDVFIPDRKSKAGKRFAFVRFIKVDNVDRLVGNLCTLWIGRMHLHANVARFDRPPIHSSRPNISTRPAANGASSFASVLKGNPNIMFNHIARILPGLVMNVWGERDLIILTKLEDNILEKFKIIVRGKIFVIRAKELFVWSLTLNDNKEVDDYSEDDSVNGAEEINGHLVADGLGRRNWIEYSSDPFNLYNLLNKRDKGETNSGLDSSIPFPPGFTPEREFQHVDAQEVQGMENSLSKRRSEGLSSRVLEDAQPLNEHASPSIDSKKKQVARYWSSWDICNKWGVVINVYIAAKRSKSGHRFGFVRFINVNDINQLVSNLRTAWMGGFHLFADVAKYGRTYNRPVERSGDGKPSVGSNSQSVSINENVFQSFNSYAKAVLGNKSVDMSGKYGTSNAGAESVGVSDCNKVYKEAGNEAVMSISVDDCIDLDGMERSILAKVKDLSVISELLKHMSSEGFDDVGLRYVGGRWVWLEFDSMGLPHDFIPDERCVWIDLVGLPLASWAPEVYKKLGGRWDARVYDMFAYWAPNIESMEVNSESNPLERKDAEGLSLDESLENEEHLDVDSCDSDSPKNVNNDSVSPLVGFCERRMLWVESDLWSPLKKRDSC